MTHEILSTRVSEAFWYDRSAPQNAFQPAVMRSLSPDGAGEQVSWLDQLLGGGIRRPGVGRAQTLLLTGRPGAGKSVLAMELCYRWALNAKKRSLFISSEGPTDWLKGKAKDFGWSEADTVFIPAGTRAKNAPKSEFGTVELLSIDHLRGFRESLPKPLRNATIDAVRRMVLPKDFQPEVEGDEQLTGNGPDIVVVDSLNSIPNGKDRSELFVQYMEAASHVPDLLIVVLDSGRGENAEFWEYASDIVFRIDWDDKNAYFIRTFEIAKARFQKHTWGKHQLKVYEPNERTNMADLARAHPYRREGGIFIFPSIHYILSIYKKRAPTPTQSDWPSGVPGLEGLLPKGYPYGRCTALLGNRGGHKSHLGYFELFHRVQNNVKSRGIVVSLRDDEETTRDALGKVLQQQGGEVGSDARLRALEDADRVEILYFPPGYITPEEFFHRLLISIHRLKARDHETQITLLFNSLDQLSARFPLCAQEKNFVPAIVQMLHAEGISSFFVAAREPDQPPEYYGLESLAELILNFKQMPVKKPTYDRLVRAHREYLSVRGLKTHRATAREIKSALAALPPERSCVQVEVVRYAGGRAAGAQGLLEFIDEDDNKFALYAKQPGLHFLPVPT